MCIDIFAGLNGGELEYFIWSSRSSHCACKRNWPFSRRAVQILHNKPPPRHYAHLSPQTKALNRPILTLC